MMLITVIAPEITVAYAARQFLAARVLSKDFGFSTTHGFFFWMGGFVSSTGYPVATKKQLAESELGPEFLAGIKKIDAEDIMDKSKGDSLSKGLAMVQGLWFTAQCVARVHQHLTVTELEIREFAVEPPSTTRWLIRHAVPGGYAIWWLFGCLLVMMCIECLLPY
ncbi:hypothetical protein B0H13DRAFT_2328980 [Mycena leptocephala]|nr:hypothetical protein B0H13DRAFT_2328980 [Mycena leptocephala]